MKPCPYCAEQIQDAAVVCRFCGRDLGEEPGAVSASERSDILDQAVRHYSNSNLSQIESRTPTSATLVFGKDVNHVVHFLLGFFTFGVWWFFWLLIAATSTKERMEIVVDRDGVVRPRALKTNTLLAPVDGRWWLPRFAGERQAFESARHEEEARRLADLPDRKKTTRRDLAIVGGLFLAVAIGVIAFAWVQASGAAAARAKEAAKATTTRLELLTHGFTKPVGSVPEVKGAVRNIWDVSISDVNVEVIWKNPAGDAIGSDKGSLDHYLIEPGHADNFTVLAFHRPAKATSYGLAFSEHGIPLVTKGLP